MRKLAIVLGLMAIVLLFVVPVEAGWWQDANTDANECGYDTYIHLGLGAAGSALTYHLLPDDWSPWAKRGVAFLVPPLIALVKETTDQNFYWKDVGEYAAGSAAAVFIISFEF